MFRIRSVIAILAGLGVTACLGQAPNPPVFRAPPLRTKAWDLLARTMEHDRYITCAGVMLQRDTLDPESLMELFVEQSGHGELKYTVLSPLSKQGITVVDDGQQWLTYHPDEGKVIVQPSPHLTTPPASFRIHLARKNYDLAAIPGDLTVAGHRVNTLLATSKFADMPSRVYSIDRKRDFLLKMEIVNGGQHKVMMDTKEMDYPPSIPADHFQIPMKATIETHGAPLPIALGRNAKNLVGFDPAVPKTLPFGFAVYEPRLGGSEKSRFVAVRISDGLVNATVYEWDRKKLSRQWRFCKDDRDAKGIGMRLVGEVPEVVLVKLLDTFVNEALKGIEPMMVDSQLTETNARDQALNLHKDTGDGQTRTSNDGDGPIDLVVAWIEVEGDELSRRAA